MTDDYSLACPDCGETGCVGAKPVTGIENYAPNIFSFVVPDERAFVMDVSCRECDFEERWRVDCEVVSDE